MTSLPFPLNPRAVAGQMVAVFLLFSSLLIVWHLPWILLATLALFMLSLMIDRSRWQHLNGLAASRAESSYGAFRRTFDSKTTDGKVIRAVWEALQANIAPATGDFPIAADDDLYRDLRLDEDDITLDIARRVSISTGRTLKWAQHNPHWARLNTPHDLVLFFNAQPTAIGAPRR